MVGIYRIRTDLALENGEKFEKDNVEVEGVSVRKKCYEDGEICVSTVEIKTEHGARIMEKPCGIYITVEIPDPVQAATNVRRKIVTIFSECLQDMLPIEKNLSILVVGLGNREVTPDALGPMVVQKLEITRHMMKEYGNSGLENGPTCMVSSIAPGVMAQTGMETLEILRGIVEETHPHAVIAVDALAARSTRRLNRTIQLTDTGIHPGAGIGNNRSCLSEETLGIPVIGVGVPTVVDAAGIVHDAVTQLLEEVEESEVQEFLRELITPNLQRMFVTPKDVDEEIRMISKIVSEGVNAALAKV